MFRHIDWFVCFMLLVFPLLVIAAQDNGKGESVAASSHKKGPPRLRVDQQQVTHWNLFAQQVLQVHYRLTDGKSVYRRVEQGGYMGMKNFYTQYSYYAQYDDRLLSRVSWETAKPETLHSVEVFIYNKQGELALDYLAAYLPRFRNAPIQTLINLHHHGDEVHAYRQFDASGARIYEQCRGRADEILLSLDEEELPGRVGSLPDGVQEVVYRNCFGMIALSADSYLNPLSPGAL